MNKSDSYKQLLQDLPHIIDGKNHYLTSLANLSAELKQRFATFSWAGFYLYDGDKLFLGPFQGKPACEIIALDRGVCGKSARERKTVVVPDVHQFPGHIACDGGSNSEIVVPMVKQGRLLGVLDIDSYEYANFDDVDKEYLEQIVRYFIEVVNFPNFF